MDIDEYWKNLRNLIGKINILDYLKIIFIIVSVILSKNNLFFMTNAALVFSILNSFIKKEEENDKLENKFSFDFEIFIFQCFTLFYLNRQMLLVGIKLFDIEYFSKIILNARYLQGEIIFLILFGLIYVFASKKGKAYKFYIFAIILYFCLLEDVFSTGFSLMGIQFVGILLIFVNAMILPTFIDFVIISLVILYFMKKNKNYKLTYLLLIFCFIFRLSLAARFFLL